MSSTDSSLMFEVIVDSLKSYIDLGVFTIKCQFANRFILQLKDNSGHHDKRKCKKKGKIGLKKQSGQTVFSIGDTKQLIKEMKQFPMEVSLWSKTNPENKVGSVLITWSQIFINYLKKLKNHLEPPPATITHEYSVFDELTSKRMATVKLNMRLGTVNENRAKLQTEHNCNHHRPTSPLTKIQTNNAMKKPISNSNIGDSTETQSNDKKLEDTINNSQKCNNEINIYKEIREKGPQSTRSIDVLPINSDESRTSTRIVSSIKTRSLSSLQDKCRNQTLSEIFDRPFQSKVYTVGYVTVDDPSSSSPKDPNPAASSKEENSETKEGIEDIDENSTTYRFKLCDGKCKDPIYLNPSTINLPNDLGKKTSVTKCKNIYCENRTHQPVPDRELTNDQILIDMKSMLGRCCEQIKVEELVGEVKLKMDSDPCSCSCECTFGFTKKTTYCTVCGGYESAGEDVARVLPYDLPYPCPVYHNIIDRNKIKNIASFGSDGKRKDDSSQKGSKGALKGDKKTSGGEKGTGQASGGQAGGSQPGGGQSSGGQTSGAQTSGGTTIGPGGPNEKEDKKGGKKKRKNDKFKFNYGYHAPHIGHSQCMLPCGSSINPVPKSMGWRWNTDIPGLKYRPKWKPGAAHKHVVRMLRIAKNPGEVLTKRKRKDTSKKKRPLKRPLLVVQKRDGEFTITIETMKAYNKPRALNQQPYEDKPPVTYTIGRTEEENRLRQKKKQREKRRLEKAQRMFIQNTFQNLCKDICIKTYEQALGILPDTEKADCTCYPALPDASVTNMDVSCSCSQDSLFSDSDSDGWIIEFSPPNCLYDPTYKPKKTPKTESFAQYSYLDYKVRKLDKSGKEVPRYFIGPDGKQYCSDLGGFRGQDGKWYEINVDGYIGPDGRWFPCVFTGPNGELVDADGGTFQTANGQVYEIGVHGYVDAQGKWRFYSKSKGTPQRVNKSLKVEAPPTKASDKKDNKAGGSGDKKDLKTEIKPSETFSCFGDTSAKQLSKLGIVGHGHDKKLLQTTVKDMISKGVPVKMPEYTTIPRYPGIDRQKQRNLAAESRKRFLERSKCKHAIPSDKGVIAVDGLGNKTFFRLKEPQNMRPKERVLGLTSQGISLSSFHVPCFSSFINAEYMRQQQCMRILELAQQCKNTATQVCV